MNEKEQCNGGLRVEKASPTIFKAKKNNIRAKFFLFQM